MGRDHSEEQSGFGVAGEVGDGAQRSIYWIGKMREIPGVNV